VVYDVIAGPAAIPLHLDSALIDLDDLAKLLGVVFATDALADAPIQAWRPFSPSVIFCCVTDCSNPLDGIFERDAFRVVFPEPCFGRVLIGENLQMVAVSDQLSAIDVYPDCLRAAHERASIIAGCFRFFTLIGRDSPPGFYAGGFFS
jgi:hypothetical protein